MSTTLALYVHGMGRTSVSGWPLLWSLQRAGLKTATFDYSTWFEPVPKIIERLAVRIASLRQEQPCDRTVIVAHSLGGVLTRAALALLPPDAALPSHLFLLGSPIQSPRLARLLCDNLVFRVFTQDCGQFLASLDRMATVGAAGVPTTAIVGTRGLGGRFSPFGEEPNDGLVSLSEASADWLDDVVSLDLSHTFLPMSDRVANVVLERLQRIDA